MSRLYWKIFLSFWGALILFAAASILAATFYIEHTRDQHSSMSLRERTLQHIGDAREIARAQGKEGLQQWLGRLDRNEAIPYFLIDQGGADLLGRPVPYHLQQRIQRGRMAPLRHQRERRMWHRALVALPDGSEYRLLPDFKGISLGRILSRPKVMAIPLVIAALISGLVCFLLARYLTTPIDRLRRATYHYANGDLGHRVLPSMNDRKDEIADLARDFDDMAQHLQALIASHKQLLSDVSHELRSPLARMQVALGLAQQREGEAENPELARIELEAERLNELIGQLLTLSRMESATADLQATEIDLRQLLLEIAKNANYEAAEKDCNVKLASPESIMLEADPQLLRSALENIVRNAVIYTDQATSIDITVQTDAAIEQGILIMIHDHGPGVPEDMLPRLFDPFVRVGEARDRQSGGYGLGLAIAERAIHLHGGMIEAENAPGGGLIVCVRLPCRQSK